MPPEPSVTSASVEPWWCTSRYSSALFGKSFERPGPKSVTPAMNCSGVDVVVSWKWRVGMRAPLEGGDRSRETLRASGVQHLPRACLLEQVATSALHGRARRTVALEGNLVCPSLSWLGRDCSR